MIDLQRVRNESEDFIDGAHRIAETMRILAGAVATLERQKMELGEAIDHALERLRAGEVVEPIAVLAEVRTRG